MKLSKINQILQEWTPGMVVTSTWLRSKGIDKRLADSYVKNNWFERLARGVFKRSGDHVDWPGVVQALQKEGINLHPGGKTSLALQGYGHYIKTSLIADFTTLLFSDYKDRLRSHNELATKGWTINFRPWKLVHSEVFESKQLARKREQQLKSAAGP